MLNSGFTLIELLIVISIIAILGALSSFGLKDAFANARNTQRLSDLKQYQTALEAYGNRGSGLYIARTADAGTRVSTIVCTDMGLSVSDCPEDPQYIKNASSWSYYSFESNGTDGTLSATNYVMWARNEDSTTSYSVVCSTGKSGKMASAPSATNGVCPI